MWVAGPFTVESISPYRVLDVDENGDVIDGITEAHNGYGTGYDFGQILLDNLRRSGVQQAHREDCIIFTSLTPWPGRFVCAEGRYVEGGSADNEDAPSGPERWAVVFIEPEFGTVSHPGLVEAVREATDGGFDVLVLIASAFNYDAHTTKFESLGRIPVVKARMNADLHMAGCLRSTCIGNLFVIFGEPDIDVLGAGDPYKSLKTTLRAEIDENSWVTMHSATSRPFTRPESVRIVIKVISHLGDEVMKVFRVG